MAASVYTSHFSRVDEYGFKRAEDFDYVGYDKFMTAYLPVLVRRGQKWDKLLAGPKGALGLKKGIKLKRFVRKGIPLKHRASVWMAISGAAKMREAQPDLYTKMLSKRVSAKTVIIEQIATDIPRTFPSNIYFHATDPKSYQQPLFNVLLAYSNVNPDVGYCQGLNYVAGLLLLVTKDEDQSFWLLRALTENILPNYYAPDIPGLMADIKVFAEILCTKNRLVYDHVETMAIPWELICSKWFICLYSDVLPVETVLRIWDCLFYDGSKILMRVAITLIKLHEDKLMRVNDFAELVNQFKIAANNVRTTQCHDFINSMFELSSPMPSKMIEKLREDKAKVVQQEQEQLLKNRTEET